MRSTSRLLHSIDRRFREIRTSLGTATSVRPRRTCLSILHRLAIRQAPRIVLVPARCRRLLCLSRGKRAVRPLSSGWNFRAALTSKRVSSLSWRRRMIRSSNMLVSSDFRNIGRNLRRRWHQRFLRQCSTCLPVRQRKWNFDGFVRRWFRGSSHSQSSEDIFLLLIGLWCFRWFGP